jgi:hypothetical protein
MHASMRELNSLYKDPINSHSFSLQSKTKKRLNQSKWEKGEKSNKINYAPWKTSLFHVETDQIDQVRARKGIRDRSGQEIRHQGGI